MKTTHTGTLGLRSIQSFRRLVLEVYSRVLSHFSSWYSRDSRVLSHFSSWYPRDLRVLKSFQLLVLQGLASTQSFQLLVLQGFASTQVISAFGTPGTREYSSHFSFWYCRYSRVLKSFQLLVLQALASTQSFQFLVLQELASTQVIPAFGTPGTGEYSSHFSFWYYRDWRVLQSFQL